MSELSHIDPMTKLLTWESPDHGRVMSVTRVRDFLIIVTETGIYKASTQYDGELGVQKVMWI